MDKILNDEEPMSEEEILQNERMRENMKIIEKSQCHDDSSRIFGT